jgi:hypothetical protein
MASTCPICPSTTSHMHRACPPTLGSHALSNHRFAGDKLNCGSGEYIEKHATIVSAHKTLILCANMSSKCIK